MQNVGAYFRSWFGRFEAVAYRRPDPWLALPAVALVALGTLMVLNTTYFLGQEKTGDSFHFFKLHLLHIVVGLAVLAVFPCAGRSPISIHWVGTSTILVASPCGLNWMILVKV